MNHMNDEKASFLAQYHLLPKQFVLNTSNIVHQTFARVEYPNSGANFGPITFVTLPNRLPKEFALIPYYMTILINSLLVS